MRPRIIIVIAQWDPDAAVWVATSQDVPGLVTEADTLELLEEKLQVMIPELLEANRVALPPRLQEIPFTIITHRENVVTLHA